MVFNTIFSVRNTPTIFDMEFSGKFYWNQEEKIIKNSIILERLSSDFKNHFFEIREINNRDVLFINGKRKSDIFKKKFDHTTIFVPDEENIEEALYQDLKEEVRDELSRRKGTK